ncbi:MULTISPECIES: PE family protein [Mycobacterium]|uniref:PE family protein n=1 Tax=Mycobacterium TaxID=1763 RepID=UPI00216C39BB|nr:MULTISPECIES: PE family protein [Mycobacterium]BDE17323.1 PE family protein PE32 [Mycobacterium sp. 20KCMC460]GLB93032.1 PE family protein PE32 [Mycobacterium kiyosense]GLB99217.1 PE family protein PE32 [Mycobacterium kiyosense]GLC04143.1 PE family protein PE32 [Mycobacterium kiyosense]GLC11021.1 PE family protein PE32 [Mycobacterium kiyosense]
MSTIIAVPDILAGASGELLSINETMRAGSAVAAGPTTAVVPAAADLVSLLTATQFANHARLFQDISAQAAAVQEQLATTLGVSAGSYEITEAANAAVVR